MTTEQKFETEIEYEVLLPLEHGTLNLKVKVPPSTLSIKEIKNLIRDLTTKILGPQEVKQE